ncbi:hypothetical protein N7467_003596 [Penicillium canescens]|nr:hypothetical protein N7467_003596 [Penicillium canescens]
MERQRYSVRQKPLTAIGAIERLIYPNLSPQSACHSSNPAMSKNNLLPRERGLSVQYLEADSSKNTSEFLWPVPSVRKESPRLERSFVPSRMELTQCSASARPHAQNVRPKLASASIIQPVIGGARLIPPIC